MKLIDGFLSFLGFESNIEEKKLTDKQIQKLKIKQNKKQEKLAKKYDNNKKYIDKNDSLATSNDLNTQNKQSAFDSKINTIIEQKTSNFFIVNNEEDIKIAVNTLKVNKILYLDLSKVEQKLAERSIDFILGALYVLNGTIERISNNKFLLKI